MHMSEVTIAYGMTETSPVSFQSGVETPWTARRRPLGECIPMSRSSSSTRTATSFPGATPGELLTRGYNVMRGYWDDPERTSECLDAAGWMHTGDLATLDEEGYRSIVGRVKDMIIRGGENSYRGSVEEYLLRHPQGPGCSGRRCPPISSMVKWSAPSFVWRDGASCTESEILDYCREQIAHFKVPRFVRFVDVFPMTVTGKVQKYLLREQQIKELGREPAV